MTQLAGGTNLADFEATRTVDVGSTWFLEEKYAADYLICASASYYDGSGFTESTIASLEEKFKDHSAWKSGNAWLYSTSIPVVARVAYMAEVMYSDLFESGWANSVHQLFVDTYFDVEFEVNQDQFLIKIS